MSRAWEKRFNIEGTMSGDIVQELESLLLTLGQFDHSSVTLIKRQLVAT